MKNVAFAFAQNLEITASEGCLVGVWDCGCLVKCVNMWKSSCCTMLRNTAVHSVQSYVSEKGFVQILSDNAEFEEF